MRRRCAHCGERLYRVHRTFLERFRYLAIYECRHCKITDRSPRSWATHLGKSAQCPQCGTHRLTRLRERDRIDRVHRGFLNFVERALGGKLHHCRFCRLQFWDRRPLAVDREESHPLTTQPDTASSGG